MRHVFAPIMPRSASAGLLFVRIVVGLAFVFHGYPKILRATMWMGSRPLLMPTTGAALLVVPPWLQATAAAVEFFGGIALIVGLLTRLAGLALCIDMIVAFLFAELPHHTPFVGSGHTLEPNLTYMVVSFLLLLTGPGVISLDALLTAPLRRIRRKRAYYEHRGPNLVMPG
jgi:putative oxidoreductase